MIFDWVIYGVIIWGVSGLLNRIIFDDKPASNFVARGLTVVMFFASLLVLSFAKAIRFQLISEDLGFEINPPYALDLIGAFVFSSLFYTFLNKKVDNIEPVTRPETHESTTAQSSSKGKGLFEERVGQMTDATNLQDTELKTKPASEPLDYQRKVIIGFAVLVILGYLVIIMVDPI